MQAWLAGIRAAKLSPVTPGGAERTVLNAGPTVLLVAERGESCRAVA